MIKAYIIAGPDVFRSNTKEYFENIKKLCKLYNIIALCPSDNQLTLSKDIFNNNINLIKECDIVIANLMSFREVC